MDIRNARAARILGGILALQAVAYYAVAARREFIPNAPPLSSFPETVGDWRTQREYPMAADVEGVLRADDTLNRLYANSRQASVASLFIAYFKTQRYGQSPHSPKNCLPGSGWQPTEDQTMPIAVAGRETPIVVRRYVISRGEQESMVLYWYQSHSRVIAGEFAAKFWLVADAIRYRRSDTALVRVIVPVSAESPRSIAEKTAVEFVQAVYPEIARQLPQ